ncbi:hypothetical protein LTS10_000751 [Elasticomyces elasticus]|nr:hypothetical protein LTS10_000751 [Elasticomyces elasticus]
MTRVLRGLQVFLSAAVLGLAINSIIWQTFSSVPGVTYFCAFLGLFGIIAPFVDIGCGHIVPRHTLTIVDVLSWIFFFAGGMAHWLSVGMVQCNLVNDAMRSNRLLNGGCGDDGGRCGFYLSEWNNVLVSRCRKTEAIICLLWVILVVSLLVRISGCLAAHKGGRGVRLPPQHVGQDIWLSDIP